MFWKYLTWFIDVCGNQCRYSQTCVQRSLFGPQNSARGRYLEVILAIKLQNGTPELCSFFGGGRQLVICCYIIIVMP